MRLKPKTFRFFRNMTKLSASHQGTKLVTGAAQEPWNIFFKDFEWVEDVLERRQTPVLMFVDGEWRYFYLLLASRENNDIDPVPKTEQNLALLKKIKKSLHPSTCERNPFVVQFRNCSLDMSNVVLNGILNCPHLFQEPPKKNVVMAIYGENFKNFETNIFRNQMALVKLEGFRLFVFHKDDGYNSVIMGVCQLNG